MYKEPRDEINAFIDYITPLQPYQIILEYSSRPRIERGLAMLQRYAWIHRDDKQLMKLVSKAYEIYHNLVSRF